MKSPFIPSWLDELGLSVRQFRVLCHLWRRGETYSNAATIAETCRIKRETVFATLNELEALGLVSRKRRSGRTTIIQPVTPKGTGPGSNPSPPSGQVPSPETGQGASPQTGRHPSPQTGHKGAPIKEIPKRKSPKGAARQPKLSDEAFIDTLKANAAFAGINIDHEIGKMQAWLLTKPGRTLTRPFMISWLNRAEKPVAVTSKAAPLNMGRRGIANGYNENIELKKL